MKYLIISDIHGNYENLSNILKKENFDELIILGDLFSYSLSSYDEKEYIINLLLSYKNKLILLKGNCDYYINFEAYGLYFNDIVTLHLNNYLTTLTHGNIYTKYNIPNLDIDIFISGHTHIGQITKENNIIYANPGSINNPRGGSKKSYLIFDNNKLILKDLDQNIIKEMTIN